MVISCDNFFKHEFYSVKLDGLEMEKCADQIETWMDGQITIWDVVTKNAEKLALAAFI